MMLLLIKVVSVELLVETAEEEEEEDWKESLLQC